MLRLAFKSLAVAALLAGLLLRAITPLGYMPATLGSGFLFELCPAQLPPQFALPGATASKHAHHHGAEGASGSAPHADQCDIGHLLFAAIAADTAFAEDGALPRTVERTLARRPLLAHSFKSTYRSRAPPA